MSTVAVAPTSSSSSSSSSVGRRRGVGAVSGRRSGAPPEYSIGCWSSSARKSSSDCPPPRIVDALMVGCRARNVPVSGETEVEAEAELDLRPAGEREAFRALGVLEPDPDALLDPRPEKMARGRMARERPDA